MMGEVDALGAGVEGSRPGDAVAIEPMRSCGRCAAAGRDANPSVASSTASASTKTEASPSTSRCRPGASSPCPADLAPQLAALAEPMAVVVHGLRRARFEPGQRVLVLGAGSLGLLGALAARALGAERGLDDRPLRRTRRSWPRSSAPPACSASRRPRPRTCGSWASESPIDCVVETVGGSRRHAAPGRGGGAARRDHLGGRRLHGPPSRSIPTRCSSRRARSPGRTATTIPHEGADFETATASGRRAPRRTRAASRRTSCGLDEIARGFAPRGGPQGRCDQGNGSLLSDHGDDMDFEPSDKVKLLQRAARALHERVRLPGRADRPAADARRATTSSSPRS